MNQKSVSDRNGAEVVRDTIVDDKAADGFLPDQTSRTRLEFASARTDCTSGWRVSDRVEGDEQMLSWRGAVTWFEV